MDSYLTPVLIFFFGGGDDPLLVVVVVGTGSGGHAYKGLFTANLTSFGTANPQSITGPRPRLLKN